MTPQDLTLLIGAIGAFFAVLGGGAKWLLSHIDDKALEFAKPLTQRRPGGFFAQTSSATPTANAFIGSPQQGRYFCNQWVSEPFLQAPATFGPHQFAAISLSLGSDLTKTFFKART